MLILGLLFGLAACGGAQADGSEEQFQIRKPKATFTPTSVDASIEGQSVPMPASGQENNSGAAANDLNNTANNTGEANESTDSQSTTAGSTGASTTATDAQLAGSQVTINFALVNGRSGPSTDFDIVGVVAINEVFDVLGQNEAGDWWQLCCYLDQEFWVIDEYADFQPGPNFNANNAVAAAVPAPQAIPADTPIPAAPAAAPAAPTATAEPVEAAPASAATGDFAFDLVVQEQFSEETVVRVYLYVFSDQVQALEGYSVKVTKNGVDLPVGSKSYGPQAGYTWPVSTARQRFENMKVEFPGESPEGTWTVELTDGSGQIVGPPATFELSRSEPNQELYVRYKQR